MYTTSGVNSINKQRFLTELSKFLTFLSDEEKEQILLTFSKIFDSCDNEEDLLSTLVSPLKVTVELSRAYSKGGIDSALSKSVELSGIELKDNEEDEYVQESLFEDSQNEEPSKNETEKDIYTSIENAVEAAFESSMNDAVINNASTNIPIADESEDDNDDEAETEKNDENAVSDSTVILDVKKITSELPIVQTENLSENNNEANDNDVKSYVAPIKKTNTEIKANQKENSSKEDFEFIDSEPKEFFEGSDPSKEPKIETKKQLKLFSLILFIIVFIPIGIIGIFAILLVAAALVALMISAVGTGIFAINLTFSGMTMFADIIMTLGVSLVCFAFGVIFLWAAIWLLIWAISHLIKGIFTLCKSWCYKEVVVE